MSVVKVMKSNSMLVIPATFYAANKLTEPCQLYTAERFSKSESF